MSGSYSRLGAAGELSIDNTGEWVKVIEILPEKREKMAAAAILTNVRLMRLSKVGSNKAKLLVKLTAID